MPEPARYIFITYAGSGFQDLKSTKNGTMSITRNLQRLEQHSSQELSKVTKKNTPTPAAKVV